jgi:hypothetical protein
MATVNRICAAAASPAPAPDIAPPPRGKARKTRVRADNPRGLLLRVQPSGYRCFPSLAMASA